MGTKRLTLRQPKALLLNSKAFSSDNVNMGRQRPNFKIPMLLLALMAPLISCSPKNLSIQTVESRKIQGVVEPLQGSMTLSTSCTDPKVKIYALNAQGEKLEPSLAETDISSDGSYLLNVTAEGFSIRKNQGPRYLLETDGCSESFSRTLTDNKNQDLNYGSSLIAYSVGTSLGPTLTSVERQGLESFLKSIGSSTSMSSSYSSILANSGKTAQFTSLFGGAPVILFDLPPKLSQVSVPTPLDEQQAYPLTINTSHWSPAYNTAVLWKIGNDVIDQGSNVVFTPDANAQGSHTITVYWGQEDGSGNLDLAKPYDSKSFNVQIANTIPPTPPAIFAPSSTGGYNIQIDIDTGNAFSNCASFSTMALTENQVLPPPSSAFTLTCTTAVTQTMPYTLSPGGGVKTLRLWVKDAAGNISVTSSTVDVEVDFTPPTVTLDSLTGGELLAGGHAVDIAWTASDSYMASQPVSLYYSTNSGSSWILIADHLDNTSPYSWTLPLIDSSTVRLKVTAVDVAGNVGEDESSSDLTIDSTAPTAPAFTITSDALSNSLTAALSVTCTADDAAILLSESPLRPDEDAAEWQTCLSSMNFNVSSGDGVKTIYAWSKDAAGNVSLLSHSDTFTLDQTPPDIHLTNYNSGHFKGNTPITLTWTATDLHLGAATVDIKASVDDGVSWSDIVLNTDNDGSYAFTLPNLDSNQYRIQVSACDEVGNCGTGMSTNALAVDISAPVISNVTLNNGDAYAGTAITAVSATITDNYSDPTDISIRTANAHPITGDCQSEYADNNWKPYTDAATTIPHQVSPTDGVKKVCVWAKDAVGNITVYSPTTGTDGVDTDTIIFEIGNPPVIDGFSVIRNAGGTIATIGDPMTITWNATDVEGLNDDPVSFSYTTDNNTWLDLTTNGDTTNPDNVTWIGGFSGNPTSANGTITTWTAPSSTSFRVRVVARDKSGNYSIPILSQAFNANRWSVYAGSKDRGVGGSGTAAALYASPTGNIIAVQPLTGDFYAVDQGYGIKKLDAKTGLVSLVFGLGTSNLPDDGALPATPILESTYTTHHSIHFDSKGRLYISTGSYADSKIYQVDFTNNHVRLYAGGGSNSDGGVLSTTLMTTSNFTFDESDNMYVVTMCAPMVLPYVQGKRLVKIAQNSNGTPGSVTRIMGDCTYAAPSYGSPAVNSPLGTIPYPSLGQFVVFNNGANIYLAAYGGTKWKIVNGTVYTADLPSGCNSTPMVSYSPTTGKVYVTNATCGIDEITPAGAQNNGEVSTTLFAGSSTSVGCTKDGVLKTDACVRVAMSLSFGGTLYFTDGVAQNSPSYYRIRYMDGDFKMRTLFGSLPFVGDGMDKSVIRGSFAGIYYKKSSEPNQSAFGEGLYFLDSDAGVFGHIDPVTDTAEVLWGNQSRKESTYATGDTISKDINMGSPYSGGSFMPLTFDSTGLPWLRAEMTLIKINASKQIERKTGNNSLWSSLAEGADPTTSSLYPYGAREGFSLKGQSLFLLGAPYIYPGVDPNMSIRIWDFATLTSKKIMGGNYLNSDAKPQSADQTAGNVLATPLWYNCYYGNCHTGYDSVADRLYFSEQTKIRYITTPSNTSTATLGTFLTTSDGSYIYNFTFNPSRTQLWYATDATTIRCHDISSGKSWCDDTTNHFSSAADAGFQFDPKAPNIFTWKDDTTLYLSTYSGEILQFILPTDP
jgi:hypothetical protein